MKSFWRQIHLVEQDQQFVLFHPPSMAILRIGPALGAVVRDLSDGEELAAAATKQGLDVAEVREAEEKLRRLIESKSPVGASKEEGDGPPTLYLNVSNACNLACVYCYAHGGSYDSPPGMMTEETARTAIDRFYDQFGRLKAITFFGGEPLMRASLIPQACDYAFVQADRRGVSRPTFTLVTNGTMLTAENVEFLKSYGFQVTVSIDGPAVINDVLRPSRTGTGSHASIVEGLKRLRTVGIVPNVESTYTAKHFLQGVTPKDLLVYFQREFGIPSITIGPAAPCGESDEDLAPAYSRLIPAFREAARYSLESLEGDQPILLFQVGHVLRYLLPHRPRPNNQFCYTFLGKELFAVSSTGDIYPCQMMTDRKEFGMGNVTDPDFAKKESFHAVSGRFEAMEKDRMQCRNCWAKGLCFICVAGVEIETGKLAPIPQHRCDLIQGVIEEILLHLNRIGNDSARLDRLGRRVFGG